MTLSTRILLLGGLLSAGLVTLFGWQTLAGQRAAWRQRWTDTVRMDADAVRLRVQAAAADVSRDVRYLSASPLLRLFVAGGGEEARRLVEEDFQAMLVGTPSYFQVRVIGVADEGREIVRIDRADSGVVTVPVPELQRKGDRDYVREGLALPDAAVALSDINLNQERGAVSLPHIPTLRATAPVSGANGSRFGLVVINVDLRALWREILAAITPGVEVRLVNQKGEYVLHPDPGALHGLDLRTGVTAASPDAPRPGGDAIVFGQTFDLDSRYPMPLRLEVSAPAEVVAGGLRRIQQRALAVTGLAAVGALALVGVMARRITARLQRVSDAIARYTPGEAPDSLPPAGEDEAGVLAGKARELAQRVRDDRARIDGARRQAEEAVRAKDEFLAVMSHEIRTPLNAVSGLLRVLEGNRPAPHQQPILTSMRAAANNLLALVNNALDYSRLKAGRMELTPGPFDPSALLEQIRLTYEPLARLKNLAFTLDFDEALPRRLTGDAVRIAQILGNLVSNAVKFTSGGEVELAADWEPDPAGTAGRLRLRVSDTGVGIAPENLSRVFAPFEQAPEGKGLAHDGAGLGLAITKGLVTAMGGELSVSSQPGQGSRFSVVLPLAVVEAAAPAPEDQPRPPATAGAFSGLRVLHVEDVESNQWVMDSCLAGSGAEVTHASDAATALALASSRSFDLLLLDLQLPDRSGLALAPDLRALQPAACALAVTASVSEPLAAQVLQAGMRAVVTKPVDRDLLLAAMREALLDPTGNPEPDVANLRAALGHDPTRSSRLCSQLASEFREHHRQLAASSPPESAELARRIHHKLTSAASLLRLEALHSLLDRLASPPISGAPGVLRERVLAWLVHYAAWFERSLSPTEGNPHECV